MFAKFTLVYRLKSVGALKMKFVAPMPEQIITPTMHFSEVSPNFHDVNF